MGTEAGLSVGSLRVGSLEVTRLHMMPAEVTCLSGPSGSGKSRLLRALADLAPHDGDVWLDDCERQALAGHEWRRRVMLVAAESHWWANVVGDHLADEFTLKDLEALGLAAEVLEWEVARLSSGERQRLALLRAVSHAPSALLLDEPTANLDEQATLAVEAWLMMRIRARNWPVLWVTHDRHQIERVADRHLHLHRGRLREEPVCR